MRTHEAVMDPASAEATLLAKTVATGAVHRTTPDKHQNMSRTR